MTQTGCLSRNRVAGGCVQSRSASRVGRAYWTGDLARPDFVTDNEAARSWVIEIKTPGVSSAESLLLAMAEAFAADSPLSDGDEQLLSLP